MCAIENIAVVVASYRSVSRNLVRFKALERNKKIGVVALLKSQRFDNKIHQI